MDQHRIVKPRSRKEKYYIDNVKFLEEIVAFKVKVNYNKDNGLERPKIPDYLGKCFLLIAEKLSTTKNFIGYIHREEMISDALENCVRYIDNFNPDKGSNPFAYFTQITYYAFLRRIYGEKKQLYIKYKLMLNQDIINNGVDEVTDETSVGNNLDNEKLNVLVKSFEENLVKKKENRKQMLLDRAIVDFDAVEKELEKELVEEE